jgi:hypothetical protein
MSSVQITEHVDNEEQLQDRLHALLFSVRRSIRYHNYRRRFFDNLSTVVQLATVIFGSATVFAVMSGLGVAVYVAAMVTILSAINIVISPVRKSILHAELAKRFIDLENAITGVAEMDEQQLREFEQQRLKIERDEPPVLRVLDSLCHNEQLRAEGYEGDEHYVEVPLVKRLLAQFTNMGSHNIKPKTTSNELQKAKG